VVTATIPIIIPRVVKTERSLFARIALKAIASISGNSIKKDFIIQNRKLKRQDANDSNVKKSEFVELLIQSP